MRGLRFDFDVVRRGVLGQLQLIDDVVTALPREDFDRPTRLGDWRVAELVAHVGMPQLPGLLTGAPAPAADFGILAWAQGCAPAAADINERAQLMAEEARPAELRTLVHETRLAAAHALGQLDAEFVVPARFGAMRLADYLATRCVEATVHTLDLGAALGAAIALDADAESVAVRLLATVLATGAPGRSVELRIPPHVAVQLVEGPRHNRGTPPNVVETSARTWLELATGRLGWSEAVDTGQVSASGERADLAAYLPVLS